MARQWSEKEIDFLRANYASKNTYQLEKVWFKYTGCHRTAMSIRAKAKQICRDIKLNRKKFDIATCKNCGKKFKRGAREILINVCFCSRKCYGEWKTKQQEINLNLSESYYNKIFRRDKSYIETQFYTFSRENNVDYEDMLFYFHKFQLKNYVAISKKLNKPIRLDRFMLYAKLHILRNKEKDKKIVEKLKNELINEYNLYAFGCQRKF